MQFVSQMQTSGDEQFWQKLLNCKQQSLVKLGILKIDKYLVSQLTVKVKIVCL